MLFVAATFRFHRCRCYCAQSLSNVQHASSTNNKSMYVIECAHKNDHNSSAKLFGILQLCAIYSVCLSFIFLFDSVILIKFGMFHFCILSAVTAAVQQNTDALYKFSIFALHFFFIKIIRTITQFHSWWGCNSVRNKHEKHAFLCLTKMNSKREGMRKKKQKN